jgi:hypothetical protein
MKKNCLFNIHRPMMIGLCLLIGVLTSLHASSDGHHPKYGKDTVTICANKLPTSYGDSLIEHGGEYRIVFTTPYGYDSIIKLTVYEFPVYRHTDTLHICENTYPFRYGDSTITGTGEYEIFFSTENVCDSVIALVVYDLPVYQGIDTLYICENIYPFGYGDSTITGAGEYEIFLSTENGCDSVIALVVYDLPAYRHTDTQSLCSKELPLHYGGRDFYETGIYDVHFNSVEHCDSIIELTFTVLPDYAIYDTLFICQANYPYTYRDSTYHTAGDYMVYYKTAQNCDSIIYFSLRTFTQTKPQLTGDPDLCVSETSHIRTTNGQYAEYLWSNGDITPFIIVSDSGLYRVKTTDENGCKDSSDFFRVDNYLPVSVSGNTVICTGNETVFTASGGNYYQWNNGATTSSITVSAAGTYYVTVSNNPNCVAYDSIKLTLNPLPDLTITSPQEICIYATSGATLPVSTTLTVNDLLTVSTYRWSTNAITPSITVQPSVSTVYTVIATNQYQCTATAQTQVRAFPEIELSGDFSICKGNQATIIASGGVQYEWTGNAQMSHQTAIYTPVATSSNSIKVTDIHGCYNSKIFTITVNDLPVINILGGESTACTGDTVTLTASGGIDYLWSTGSSGNSIRVTSTNTYTVTVTNANLCTAIASKSVIFNAVPTVSIGIERQEICQGQSTNLTAIGDGSYSWSTGSSNQMITVSNNGTYIVTVTKNNCRAVASTHITVHPLPNVTISGSTSFCEGQSTTLRAPSGHLYYKWNDYSTNDSLTVSSAGFYTVTVTDSHGCSNSDSRTVSTKPVPSLPAISGPSSICQGDQATLEVNVENVTYLWSTGATTSRITVTATGTYRITVTGTNNCTATRSKSVNVHDRPVVEITSNPGSTICKGSSTTLTATASGSTSYSYLWTTNATQNFTSVSPASTTTYTVWVTDANTCQTSRDITITVNPLPTAYISGNPQICTGSNTTLTATGGNTYHWSTNVSTASITVNNADTYGVTVTSLYGCQSTASVTTTINPIPVPVITGKNVICEGEMTEFTASGGSAYQWLTPNSTSSNNPSITPTISGTYTVTVTNEGCTATRSVDFVINSKPEVNITGKSDICAGNTVTLSAYSPNSTYNWGDTEKSASIIVTPSSSRDYSVTVTNNTTTCSNSATFRVKVHRLPEPEISGSDAICPGDDAVLRAKGGVSYVWNDNNHDSIRVVKPVGATTYTVTVIDQNECTNSISKTVTIKPTPSLTVSGNTYFCHGGSTSLTASGAANVHWSTNETTSDITINQEGTYGVTITNNSGCSTSQNIYVDERDLPASVIQGELTICNGESARLTASGGSSYVWNNGASTSSIEVSPSNTTGLPRETTYTVTVTDNNCSAVTQATVTVNPSPVPFINGKSLLCQGDTITLTASGGTAYHWNNGTSTATVSVTNPGTYTVTVLNGYGCGATVSHAVTENLKPVSTIEGIRTFCAGTFTTLTATGGVLYEWNTGNSSNSITISNAGIYTVTVTNQYGCTATATANTFHIPSPEIAIIGPASICSGNETTLSVPDVYSSYLWNTGSTQSSITVSPTTAATYSVTITNAENCSAVFSLQMGVRPSPTTSLSDNVCQGEPYNRYGFNLPVQDSAGIFTHTRIYTTPYDCDSTVTLTLTVKPKPVFTGNISGLQSIARPGNYPYTIYNVKYATGYQWSINNPSWNLTQNNTNSVTLAVTSIGTGTLSVIAANECGNSEPETLQISHGVSVNDVSLQKGIDIYPNPTSEKVTVKNSLYQKLKVDIFDLHGKFVHSIESQENEFQIQMENYAKGTYLFRFTDSQGKTGTCKVVKL